MVNGDAESAPTSRAEAAEGKRCSYSVLLFLQRLLRRCSASSAFAVESTRLVSPTQRLAASRTTTPSPVAAHPVSPWTLKAAATSRALAATPAQCTDIWTRNTSP